MIDLRPLGPGNCKAVHKWCNWPNVARFMVTEREIGQAEHTHWFALVLKDESCVCWIVECDGVAVGLVCLTGIDQTQWRSLWAFCLVAGKPCSRGIG